MRRDLENPAKGRQCPALGDVGPSDEQQKDTRSVLESELQEVYRDWIWWMRGAGTRRTPGASGQVARWTEVLLPKMEIWVGAGVHPRLVLLCSPALRTLSSQPFLEA